MTDRLLAEAPAAPAPDPARAAAVEQMRAQGAAADAAPAASYPNVFREIGPADAPRSASEVAEIEGDLAAARDRQQGEISAAEAEALRRRALLLQQAARSHAADTERAIAERSRAP